MYKINERCTDSENKLGMLLDKIDNVSSLLETPNPTGYHVRLMKNKLKEMSQDIREIYTDIVGYDPWEE